MNAEQKSAIEVLKSAVRVVMEHEHCEVLVVVRACCNAHTVICTTQVPDDVDDLMRLAADIVKTEKPILKTGAFDA